MLKYVRSLAPKNLAMKTTAPIADINFDGTTRTEKLDLFLDMEDFFQKYNSTTKEYEFKFRFGYFARRVPFVNFFYDLFLVPTSPTAESVKALLDIIGILNALVLGIVASGVTGVDYGWLLEADARYGGGVGQQTNFNYSGTSYKKYWDAYYVLPPSNQLYYTLAFALTLHFISVLMAVYVYTDMIGKNSRIGDFTAREKAAKLKKLHEHVKHLAEDEKEEAAMKAAAEAAGKENSLVNSLRNKYATRHAQLELDYQNMVPADFHKLYLFKKMQRELKLEESLEVDEDESLDGFHAWWCYAKYAVFLMVLLTILGCCYTVLAARIAFQVIFPDYHVQKYGGDGIIEIFNWDCPTAYSNIVFKGAFIICSICVVLFTGFGTSRKYYLEEQNRQKVHNMISSFVNNVDRLKMLAHSDSQKTSGSDLAKTKIAVENDWMVVEDVP